MATRTKTQRLRLNPEVKMTFDTEKGTLKVTQGANTVKIHLLPDVVDFLHKGLTDSDHRLMPCLEDAIKAGLVELS